MRLRQANRDECVSRLTLYEYDIVIDASLCVVLVGPLRLCSVLPV